MKHPSRRNAPLKLDVISLRESYEKFSKHEDRIYAAAVWYAANGFHIVPMHYYGADDTGKPIIGYLKGYSQVHATSNRELIDKWWHPKSGMAPGAAICFAHGGQAGFCAVDLDVKTSANGINTLADLEMAYGDYDEGSTAFSTLMAKTPSGGRHLVFRYHPEIVSNSEVSYAGIDTRGGLKSNPTSNGGITYVEPSTKPGSDSKEIYRWDESNTTSIIDMPRWLVEVLNGRTPKKTGIKLQESYIQSATGDHGDGRNRNIYMDLMRFVGIGYTEEQLVAMVPDILERMDPPDERMVRGIIKSVCSSEAYAKAQEDGERREKSATVKLERNDKNKVIKNNNNLKTILNSALFAHEYGDIRYDDFYQHFTLDHKPLASVADYSVGISLWISETFGVDWGADTIRATVEYLAVENAHSNSAREYMLSCPRPTVRGKENFWGSGRRGPGPAFSRLCTAVLDLDNPSLHKGYGPELAEAYKGFLWFWMQGIVARACVPGCKMEIMLNLFGSQGIGKSTFFRDLCPDPSWFTDSVQDTIVSGGLDNRDELQKLTARLIVEMPELSPLKKGGKAADDKMKQFISTQVDSFRRPFGKDTVSHPRTCGLCGSSNNNDIYRDSTGDRRFVSINHGDKPFNLGDRDDGTMAQIRHYVWGELVDSFNEAELESHPNSLLVCIPPDLRTHQRQINSAHRYEEFGLPDIIEWMSDRTRITWDEIKERAKFIPGLADAKDIHLMSLVRTALNNSQSWEYKRRVYYYDRNGTKIKGNVWVNLGHKQEHRDYATEGVPPHWSTYETKAKDTSEY